MIWQAAGGPFYLVEGRRRYGDSQLHLDLDLGVHLVSVSADLRVLAGHFGHQLLLSELKVDITHKMVDD